MAALSGIETIKQVAKMQRKRWYATATTLPNGEVFVQGGKGGNDHPEIRRNDGSNFLLSSRVLGPPFSRLRAAPRRPAGCVNSLRSSRRSIPEIFLKIVICHGASCRLKSMAKVL